MTLINGISGVSASGSEYLSKSTTEVNAQASAVSATATDDAAYQAILAKASSGQPLTPAELAILKAKNPVAYAKAISAATTTTHTEKATLSASQALNNALAAETAKPADDGAAVTQPLSQGFDRFA
ncbi:MAG: hypothetical protein LBT22_03890 [Peptococcaceae bacterium]|jgi:hypothetical protein|nr:hypothetical protein [Peptococcaceae bacterium]